MLWPVTDGDRDGWLLLGLFSLRSTVHGHTHTEAALSVKRPSIHPTIHLSIHPSWKLHRPEPSDMHTVSPTTNKKKFPGIIPYSPPYLEFRARRWLQKSSTCEFWTNFSPFFVCPAAKHEKKKKKKRTPRKSKKSFWGDVSERQPRYGCFRLMDDARQSNTVSGRPQIESSSRTNIFHQPDNNGRRKIITKHSLMTATTCKKTLADAGTSARGIFRPDRYSGSQLIEIFRLTFHAFGTVLFPSGHGGCWMLLTIRTE